MVKEYNYVTLKELILQLSVLIKMILYGMLSIFPFKIKCFKL